MRPFRLAALVSLGLAAALCLPANAAPSPVAYGKEAARQTPVGCSGDPRAFHHLRYASGGGTAKALYVLPTGRPKGIVVFDHGYGHTMYSWVRHMQRTARTHGVIAIAPNYRGQRDDLRAKPLPTSRGWRVAEGAIDTNTVAQLFDRACLKGRGHNVLYSVSMGSNTAGLALAAKPKRSGGKPLWDEWINVEGAANVLQTYTGASLLAPINTFAANAAADIEQEMGGTPHQVPQVYAERTVINRVDDIVASGVKGVVIVHGANDGLVGHDISRQLQARLLAAGMPVDMTTFVTHTARSESGTTMDGYVPTGQSSPFAGHASETSETHDVGMFGFTKLAQLYSRTGFTCGEALRDGNTHLNTHTRITTPC